MSDTNSPDNSNPPIPPAPDGFAPPVPAPPAPPVQPASAAPPVPSSRKGLAIAALIVGVVAVVFAIIPGLSFAAFVPALTALALGITALATKRAGKGMAISAVVLGPVAMLIGIVVSLGAIANMITPDLTESRNDPTSEAPADEPAEPAEPEPSEVGTRENPAPFSSTIVISDNTGAIWNVTMGAATLNANDVVAAENQFNDAPDAGHQYLLVPVTFTYVGTEAGTPWIDVQVEFVSAAGTTHENAYVVIPTPITDINELYPGASATGNFVVMVPSENVDGGAWAISTFLSEKYFVAVV